MTSASYELPPILAKLHELEFDDDDGEGIDFEPYQEFQSAEDTTDWIRAWTGNDALTGDAYRVFGQDGAGGYAAFWLVREGKGLLEQPIVFFGSEGELGVVAPCFDDYLWLLAGGLGPLEAVEGYDRDESEVFTAFAKAHAKTPKKSAADVVAAARAEFPDFEKDVRALCK